jgi:DNA-binding CsgD family transcriptional regulator
MVKELDKETLKRLYLKEKRSTYDIAQMSGCSSTKVRYRCIKYGIKLRPKTRRRTLHLDKSILKRLYVEEGKSLKEVAETLSCSPGTVRNRCNEYGIQLRTQRMKKISQPLLQRLYVKEGKTTREVGNALGCSFELVRKKCHEFGIPVRNRRINKSEIEQEIL